MTGKHTNIILSFLVVGHTKFSPDWCFGLFKRKFRRTKVSSITDAAQCVIDSAECNSVQLVCTEDGRTLVPNYDWTDFFVPHMKKVQGIKKLHHFRFTSLEPGVVYVKEHADTPERKIELLKQNWCPDLQALPVVIEPKGLSAKRQWYLYDSIRTFCPEDAKDVTCPLPLVPKPDSRVGTPVHDIDLGTDETPPPPKKPKKRNCTICGQEGHNRQSCKNKN